MPDFAVATAFTGKGNIISYMNQAGAAVDKFSNRGATAFDKMSRRGMGVASVLKGLLPVLSIATVIGYANKAIQAFEESQAAIANVEAGLKSTNNAIGLTSKQIQGMAAEWQKITIFEDDAILQNVSAQLLTFGNIGKDNFDRVQRAIMDVTAKLKGINATGDDLKSTSIMMGKMMEDPVKGLSAAKRIGISFNAVEEDMVKQMVAANNTIGAQTYMLKIIERQYGGTAEALAKTDKGMQLIAEHEMQNAMENLGQVLIPIKKSLIAIAMQVLPYLNTGLAMIPTILDYALPLLKGFVIGWAIFKALQIGSSIFSAVSGIVQLSGSILPAIKQMGLLNFMLGQTTAAQLRLNLVMMVNPFILIATAIAGAIMWIVYLKNHLEEMRNLFLEITQIFDKPWVRLLLATIPGMNTAFALRDKIKEQQAQAPNRTETESRSQRSSYDANINFNNMPAGTTVGEKKKGLQPININYMGINTNLYGEGF